MDTLRKSKFLQEFAKAEYAALEMINTLIVSLHTKDDICARLEATIQEKDKRIQELEEAIGAQEKLIEEANVEIHAKDTDLYELKAESKANGEQLAKARHAHEVNEKTIRSLRSKQHDYELESRRSIAEEKRESGIKEENEEPIISHSRKQRNRRQLPTPDVSQPPSSQPSRPLSESNQTLRWNRTSRFHTTADKNIQNTKEIRSIQNASGVGHRFPSHHNCTPGPSRAPASDPSSTNRVNTLGPSQKMTSTSTAISACSREVILTSSQHQTPGSWGSRMDSPGNSRKRKLIHEAANAVDNGSQHGIFGLKKLRSNRQGAALPVLDKGKERADHIRAKELAWDIYRSTKRNRESQT